MIDQLSSAKSDHQEQKGGPSFLNELEIEDEVEVEFPGWHCYFNLIEHR